MDIENLTLKQIKEISQLVNSSKVEKKAISYPIGKFVIVRSGNEGINFGVLLEADETGCVIGNARRLWYHKPKDKKTSWYEGVSQSGLSEDSKVSCSVEKKYIIEQYSLTICTVESAESILKKKPHEAN